MTLGPLALASVLGCPLLLGLALLRLAGARVRTEPLVLVPLAWVAGCAGVAACTGAWVLLGLPLRAGTLAGTVLAVAGGAWALGARRARAAPSAPVAARRPLDAWLVATLAVLGVQLLAQDLCIALVPVAWSGSDEGLNWALPAKTLFHVGALGPEYARRLSAYTASNPDYPLLDPLLQLWTFAHAGALVHVENRFPIQLGSVALLFLLAGVLRRHVAPPVVALLMLLVTQAGAWPEATGSAGADGLAALGLLAAVACGLSWHASGAASWLRAGALALAFLAWTKNEGAVYAALVVAAFAPAARRVRPGRELAWLALPAAVVVGGALVDAWLGFRPYAERGLVPDPLGRPLAALGGYTAERVGETVRGALARVFLQPGWHSGLLAAFVGACAIAPRAGSRALTAVLAGALLVLAAVYPYYPLEIAWSLEASYERVHFHLLPSVAVALALALAQRFPRLAAGRDAPQPRGEHSTWWNTSRSPRSL